MQPDYYNGVLKVKDGLFIGNTETGEDLEFLTNNKVTRIINCAAHEQCNIWQSSEIKYLSYAWFDSHIQVIFDEDLEVLNEISEFIDLSLDSGESCLIWSVRGVSRPICVAAGYLMYKHAWSLYKTLDYLNSRKSNLNLNPNFVHQLVVLQKVLIEELKMKLSVFWDEEPNDAEDDLLKNTYFNSKVSMESHTDSEEMAEKNFRLKWCEEVLDKEERHLGSIIVKKSCLKGRDGQIFTFENKRQLKADRSEGAKQKGLTCRANNNTPTRNFIKKNCWKHEEGAQENLNPAAGEITPIGQTKRSSSVRPSSPAVSNKKVNALKNTRPWR